MGLYENKNYIDRCGTWGDNKYRHYPVGWKEEVPEFNLPYWSSLQTAVHLYIQAAEHTACPLVLGVHGSSD